MIPEEVLSQEEVEAVQRRCIGDPPPGTDPSSQQPILQDPFLHSRANSAVEEQELPNRKRYHRNSDETERVLPTSVVNRGFMHGDSTSSCRKVRKFSSHSIVSSRHHSNDSEDHALYSQWESLQYHRENSNNILHMSEVPPDAVFPMPSYDVSVSSNVGDSSGPVSLPATQSSRQCS